MFAVLRTMPISRGWVLLDAEEALKRFISAVTHHRQATVGRREKRKSRDMS